MPIPKYIWQTWKTKYLDPHIQQRVQYMLSMNPDYEYHLLDDNDLDNFVYYEYEESPEIIECYERLNIIVAKVDFWRYLALYKYGGVYVDMDSTISKPLDDLIRPEDNAIISAEGNPGYFVQWALIFNAGHPILKRAIDQVVYNVKNDCYHNDIHRTTGPTAFTAAINKYHNELYGTDLCGQEESLPNTNDITYGTGSKSYRLFGVDYNDYFALKYPGNFLLYHNTTHWREEEKQKDLLKTK
jgi:inositol phosphorylceramide mannosyltransferase catalytic subunit